MELFISRGLYSRQDHHQLHNELHFLPVNSADAVREFSTFLGQTSNFLWRVRGRKWAIILLLYTDFLLSITAKHLIWKQDQTIFYCYGGVLGMWWYYVSPVHCWDKLLTTNTRQPDSRYQPLHTKSPADRRLWQVLLVILVIELSQQSAEGRQIQHLSGDKNYLDF